jgi:hypothetical protein
MGQFLSGGWPEFGKQRLLQADVASGRGDVDT